MSVGDTVKFYNVAFKSSSGFAPITEGFKTVRLYQGDGTMPIYTSPNPIQLTGSRNYTIFTRGVINGTGNNALAVSIAINK
jgi:hypothetical protein